MRGLRWCLLWMAMTSVAGAANNPYGVQVSLSGSAPTEYLLKHYDDAVALAGEWCHIRVGADLHRPVAQGVILTLVACRAKHIIPILTGHAPPGVEVPKGFKADPDGSYDTQARFWEDWARQIYREGLTIPYYEVGNEPQGLVPPEVHARWCISVAKALHRVDPEIKVSPAGMAGSGADYYREMLKAVPELAEHMAVWSCHPYAANRPPQYDDDDLTIQGYRWTIRALEESGVRDPMIICTETGWEIGGHSDKRFPYITEDLRAQYMVEAFTRYWAPDPAIVAVTPFMLQSVPWNGWETWDFMREDDTYTPQYRALAAVPKPQGEDYLPAGDATLEGRVTDAESGAGIGRCLVWIVPRLGVGAYATETDAGGDFVIRRVPRGEYFVTAHKSYYSGEARQPVTLTSGTSVRHNLVLRRQGMIQTGFDRPEANGVNAGGLAAWDTGNGACRWDGQEGRSAPGSLRITATPGRDLGYWVATDYCAAVPGQRYALEVWVKTSDFVPGRNGGIRVFLEATNAFMLAQEVAWAPGPTTGTHDWTPVVVTVHAPVKSRRHRIALSVTGESGHVWFDDLFADKAELPLPSATALWRTDEPKGHLGGRVRGRDQALLHEATVFLTPGNFNAATDRVGRFVLRGIPPGRYQVSAVHARYSPVHVAGVEIAAGSQTAQDLVLPDIDWPDALRNGDMEESGLEPGDMPGWKPYGIISGDGIVRSGWMAGRADPDHPGFTAHSGEKLLGYVSSYNTKNGCTYQTVRAATNAVYELSAWSMTCQREGVRGDVANRIGIDPMGLDDPNSPYIIWTPFRPSPDRWSRVTLQAMANRDRITVLLGHRMISGIRWSGNFFDDVELRQVNEPRNDDGAGLVEGTGDAHLPFPLD